MQPHLSYLVCTTARSGSNLLCETLAHSGIAGTPTVEYFYGPARDMWSRRWHTRGYRDYVQRVIECCTTPNGTFGVKVMWGYFPELVADLAATERIRVKGIESGRHHGDLRKFLAEHFYPSSTACLTISQVLERYFPNLKYIFVTRQDKVRQAVSRVRAQQTGMWTSRDMPDPHQSPVFDFAAIDGEVVKVRAFEDRWQSFFDESGIELLRVLYEDLARDPVAATREVIQYLGIPLPQDVTLKRASLEKQADSLSEEWVGRYLKMKQTQSQFQ